MAGLRFMRGSAPVTSTEVLPAARRGLRLNVHPTARRGIRLHGGVRTEYHVDIPVEYFGHILGTNRWNARRIEGQCGHGTSIHGDLGEARFVVSSYCAEAAVRARDCIAQDYEHLLDRSKVPSQPYAAVEVEASHVASIVNDEGGWRIKGLMKTVSPNCFITYASGAFHIYNVTEEELVVAVDAVKGAVADAAEGIAAECAHAEEATEKKECVWSVWDDAFVGTTERQMSDWEDVSDDDDHSGLGDAHVPCAA